jgi:thioredoxin reductase (NADPH)
MTLEDIIIIGAGPAGLAASIQLKRYGFNPLIFEQGEVGGLLKNANWVENYPGFPAGISGTDLVQLFKQQAERISVRIFFEEAVKLDYKRRAFQVFTRSQIFQSRIAVIATGTKPWLLKDFVIPETLRDRIAYEIYPLLHLKGQHVVIIGAGDAAFDYALNLCKKNTITILNRTDQVKCLPLLWERAGASSNIKYCPQSRILKLTSMPNQQMMIEFDCPGGNCAIIADYLIGAIGREPRLDFISPSLLKKTSELEELGLLYFIGDVKNSAYRQTAIAAGDGLLAAMKIYCFLKESTQ